MKKDDAYYCRAECGNKPAAYGGYFQCMDKCKRRKANAGPIAPQHCINAVKFWCKECSPNNKTFCRPKSMSYGACVKKLGCDV